MSNQSLKMLLMALIGIELDFISAIVCLMIWHHAYTFIFPPFTMTALGITLRRGATHMERKHGRAATISR